ncbi:hypothetical protein [Hyphomicrobium sp.]|uniref:hypothetical protein n=1 Tax=Hyphomicrobium sp. TaxID=82 RepID=UPI002D79791C|nr:hypothetical protein [Hyphomicrobium sp.]HET6388569.1 hypothetical protein [Hyphomicrobium sp.]
MEDIRSTVDFLTTLTYVDKECIGALGICAGGGYAVRASLFERRIKAAGTVVPIDIGKALPVTLSWKGSVSIKGSGAVRPIFSEIGPKA